VNLENVNDTFSVDVENVNDEPLTRSHQRWLWLDLSGERGANVYAASGSIRRLWQTRAFENKVQLRPILRSAIRRFLCP